MPQRTRMTDDVGRGSNPTKTRRATSRIANTRMPSAVSGAVRGKGRLSDEDDKRLRDGMNKSGDSERKRAAKQPDRAGGRRDANPDMRKGPKEPVMEAEEAFAGGVMPSTKRKSLPGGAAVRKTAPKKAASSPESGKNKTAARVPKAEGKAAKARLHRNDQRSQAQDKQIKGSSRRAKDHS